MVLLVQRAVALLALLLLQQQQLFGRQPGYSSPYAPPAPAPLLPVGAPPPVNPAAAQMMAAYFAQVAAQAHRQLKVSKEGDRKAVRTALAVLDDNGRVEEVARMLGGVKVTAQTLAHAREMLAEAAAG